jgi:hypothetical protein
MGDGLFPDWIAYVIIALLIGGLLYWKFSTTLAFALKGRKASGVISNWMMAREGNETRYYPMIEFVSEDGTSHRYRAEESCEGSPLYEVGTKVEVTYLKNDPKTVRTVYPKNK